MSWLDIIIIIMIAVSTFIGLKNGLIKSVLSLAGLIVGIVLAGHYYPVLSARLTFIPQERLADIAAFVIILLVVMVIAALLAKLLSWVASLVMLGWINHLGGALLGFFMGAIFAGALLALWVKFFGGTQLVGNSFLAEVLLDRFPAILALLPDEFGKFSPFFK